jgi:hypothetical protein
MTFRAEQNGNRADLAKLLRRYRREWKLMLFDVWGDAECRTHTFYSRLDKSPFGSASRFLDFRVFPF